MSEALPPITLELEGTIGGLVAALGEATAAIEAFTKVAENLMDEGGKKAGKNFSDGIKHEIEKDDFATLLGKSLKKMVTGAKGATSGVLGSLGGLAMPAMWTGLIYGASQAVAALAPAVGALGLIPAVAMGAVQSLIALKMAFKGVGTAIQAGMSGDVQAFAEALKKLAPSAQETVKAMVKLKPAIDAMRQSVQAGFFDKIVHDVKPLGEKYLPLLRSELAATSSALGDMAHHLFRMAETPAFIDKVYEIMTNVVIATRNASGVLAHLLNILTTIGAVGSRFLPGLSSGFADLVKRLDNFITRLANDGTLEQWIRSGLDVLKLLTPLLKDAWNIINPIIKALQATGGGGLGILGTALHAVAEFLNSAQGAATLTAIFTTLNVLFSVLGDTLVALLPALGQLVIALGPTLVALFVALAPVLLDAANALVVIVNWLSPLVTWLAKAGPLVTILGDAILGILVPAIILWTINMAAAAVANIAATWEILLIIAAVAALGYAIYELIKHWRTVWNWIKSIAGNVADFFVMVWHKVQRAFDVAWGAIKDAAAAVGHFFATIWDTVIGALTAAMDWVAALPGKMLAGLRALPGLIRDVLMKLAYNVGHQIGAMIREFLLLPSQVWHIITSLWDTGYHLFVTGFEVVVNFAATIPGRISQFLWELKLKAAEILIALWHDFINGAKAMWSGLKWLFTDGIAKAWGAIKDFGAKIWDFLKGLGPKAKDAAVDAGKWLYNAGKDMIQGLINGAKSMFSSAWGTIKDFGRNLFHGFMDGIQGKSPSRLFMRGGESIVSGLVRGILDNSSDATEAVAALVGFKGARGLTAPAFAFGGALAGGFVGGSSTTVVHVDNRVYLDGKQLHAGLIQPAQRYKARTGTTGLT